MPAIEKKIINKTTFYYLFEQVRIGARYKKIQVYLGKNIPKDLSLFYNKLKDKELELIPRHMHQSFSPNNFFNLADIIKIEEIKIKWKYKQLSMPNAAREAFWKKFAIQFIFESNAIEGSHLSEKEVFLIITGGKIKKSTNRQEAQDAINSLQAFNYLMSGKFSLNQRAIIHLHKILMKNLNIPFGYKKEEIVINNKATTPAGQVRASLAKLISWFKESKKTKNHFLFIFAEFHQRFEKIHPFADGNGRTGRLIFNWMLINNSYPPLLFKKANRQAYFNALSQADEGRKRKWYNQVLTVYIHTAETFLKITT
jgi:Fic family protein